MGHETVKPGAPRSLSFEEADDPTVARMAVHPHQPSRAARKAAQNGESLARKHQHLAAAEQYRKALALDPLYYEAANNLALELQAAGHREEAEAVFKHLTETAPEHVLAFTNLAAFFCSERRYAEAEAVIRQAMKFHPYSFKANLTLGTVLIDEGKWTGEAKSTLEYAQVRYPEAKRILEKWPAESRSN
jgi:tetratricopeptide (TPR) repeat protein